MFVDEEFCLLLNLQITSVELNNNYFPQIDSYNLLLDQVTQLLSEIHSNYTAPDAPHQINIPQTIAKKVTGEIKQSTSQVIPALENVFVGAQVHVEALLASDIYPRFVRHQVTASAASALSE